MAKKQLTLSIPTPCTEDWNVMTPHQSGMKSFITTFSNARNSKLKTFSADYEIIDTPQYFIKFAH